MGLPTTVLLHLTLVTLTLAVSEDSTLQLSRQKKQFSLFSVVTFPNDQCSGSSSTSTQTVFGTCFSSSECTNKGGSADGNCAAGFGVCCVFLLSDCGSTVSNNCTYIQNPSYPSSYSTSGTCSYSVSPVNDEICQLRLDFDTLDLTESLTTGACTDSFDTTTSSGREYHSLCGTLSGQHVYVETARSTSDQTLSFTIATTSTVAQWRVKVTQIECFSKYKAPTDCYQYFTGLSNSVMSLNYPNIMIDNMLYTLCVRQEYGYCAIDWFQSATTSPDPFDLDADIAPALVQGATATASDAYITIPGSQFANYGGGALSDDDNTIADTTGGVVRAEGHPFRVMVNSKGADQATTTNVIPGFNLVYNQVPCSQQSKNQQRGGA